MSRLFALAISCVLLFACATQTDITEQGAKTRPEAATAVVAKAPERPFPNDTLYSLLVAEFALRRGAYDVAINEYMEQSSLLRDAGVSAHTTHLAQFLQREEEALQAAQLWVELEPDNAEANNTVAGLLVRQGQTLEALPYLVAVERQTGSANFPMLLNGFDQLSDERRAELVRGTNALSAEFPQNTRLLLTQSLIHADFQQYDQALEKLDMLLKLEPEQPQALLLEARILVEQKAKNPYARLQKVLKENPDDKMLRLQYASMLAATDMDAARQQFEVLSEQAPRDGDLLFSLALINRELGNNEAASQYLHQAIAIGQRVDEAYYYLGRMAEEDNDLELAITQYQQVEDGEEYFAAGGRIGQILVKKGQLDRSRAWFNEQREKNPQVREQLYGLEADILNQAEYGEEAIRLLSSALEEMPDSTSLRYARAMLSEEQDDLAAMERDLRFLLAADPDDATALNALGYTLADRTTRYAEALQLISRALALQPNEPAIMDSMGWVMYRTGRYDESVAYLIRAYANFPDPEVAAHLGEVLWVKGDTEAAMEIWQGALQSDPDHPLLLETLDRLAVDMPPIAPAVDSPTENQP